MSHDTSHDHSLPVNNEGPLVIDDDFLPPISRGNLTCHSQIEIIFRSCLLHHNPAQVSPCAMIMFLTATTGRADSDSWAVMASGAIHDRASVDLEMEFSKYVALP